MFVHHLKWAFLITQNRNKPAVYFNKTTPLFLWLEKYVLRFGKSHQKKPIEVDSHKPQQYAVFEAPHAQHTKDSYIST